MFKILKTLLLILTGIISVVIIILMILVLTNKIDIKNINIGIKHSKKIIVDKEYENIFEKIKVDSEAADIKINESDNDKIKVIVYGDKSRTSVKDNSNTLEIITKTKKCKGICLNQKIDKVEIYLPDGYENDIKLKTNYGDIKIAKISNLTANTNYGDIKISEANNYFKLNTNYGDIKISNVNITKDSKATTNLGDIKVGKTNDIYIKAKTDLGDTKVNTNNKKSSVKLELYTNLGDVKVNN